MMPGQYEALIQGSRVVGRCERTVAILCTLCQFLTAYHIGHMVNAKRQHEGIQRGETGDHGVGQQPRDAYADGAD